jgi:uncharacterized membrane protein YgaE (UPF0421/DUF939 family)
MSSLDQWRSRGASLGPRAARRSRRSARERFGRLRQRGFFIVQCALAAALAWWIAKDLLGHRQPFFAPVAAIVALGLSFGQRLRRVTEVVIGVAIGVFIGDLFVQLFGSGVWQVAVVAMVSMSLAALLGAGILMVTQAGVQAVIITTLVAQPGAALGRWLDAVVGGAIALLAATIVPASPLRKPRAQAASVVADIAAVLHDTVRALRQRDDVLARTTLQRARDSERGLDELRSLSAEGIAVVRLSPFRRRDLPGVQAIADLLEPLDRAIRNIRVLVRRASVAVWNDEPVPPSYVDLVSDLADVTDDIAAELRERRLPVAARDPLAAIGRESSATAGAHPTLSAEVMRAQVRSTVVDLLMLTGLTYDEARARVPASSALDDPDSDDEPEPEHVPETDHAPESDHPREHDPAP